MQRKVKMLQPNDVTAVSPLRGVDDGATGICRMMHTPPAPPTGQPAQSNYHCQHSCEQDGRTTCGGWIVNQWGLYATVTHSRGPRAMSNGGFTWKFEAVTAHTWKEGGGGGRSVYSSPATTAWKNVYVLWRQYHPCAMAGKGRLHVGKNLSLRLLPVPPTTPRFLWNTLWKLVL
jgi:hypothetical protein